MFGMQNLIPKVKNFMQNLWFFKNVVGNFEDMLNYNATIKLL